MIFKLLSLTMENVKQQDSETETQIEQEKDRIDSPLDIRGTDIEYMHSQEENQYAPNDDL